MSALTTSKTTAKVSLVELEYWHALYVNGICVFDDHNISPEQMLDLLCRVGPFEWEHLTAYKTENGDLWSKDGTPDLLCTAALDNPSKWFPRGGETVAKGKSKSKGKKC